MAKKYLIIVDGILKVADRTDTSFSSFVVARIKVMVGTETTGQPRPLE